MSKRENISRIISRAKLDKLALTIRSKLFSEVRILAYHRVFDLYDKEKYPFDLDLVSVSVSEFEWQMSYVKENYNPISFEVLIKCFESNTVLPENPIIVTFDDGYADNYFNAYPVLKKLSIPATIFVSTDYIGQGNTFWFDWVSFIINKCPQSEIVIDELNEKIILDDSSKNRRIIGSRLINRLKRINNNIRLDVLNELQNKYGDILAGEENDIKKLSYPLDWSQIIEMSKNGVEFGTHTASHPILTSLTDTELKNELVKSKCILQEKIGKEILVMAYPNGMIGDYSENVIKMAKTSGYKLALTYIAGCNRLNKLQNYEMKRIPVEPGTSRERFSAALVLPELLW